MLHESPVLTGHLIYCFRSRSQGTGWNLGFTGPDALLTEQVTSGSRHLISVSQPSQLEPGWKQLSRHSFLCAGTCIHAFGSSAIPKSMPGQWHRVTPKTLWALCELALLLQLHLCETKPHPDPFSFSWSWNRNSSKHKLHTKYTMISCLCPAVTGVLLTSPLIIIGAHSPTLLLSPCWQNQPKVLPSPHPSPNSSCT